ncbi:G-protein coupled receptor Mth2 isoform X2 [Musca domestica]|uniref:G-protein coupled receptor Mth2 isoform X2 n=1 Tax=Musca domestica TaxID=7370 RepID=A0ABM3V9D6_MUSDO|nr:G-protein coupled receptor Mth2 isoform X2 [Musca domestica]
MTSTHLRRLPIIILIYIFIFVPELWATASIDELEKSHLRGDFHTPCFFFQTVNVTADKRFANGSYLHDGVIIPHNLIGVYNYVYKDPVTQTRVAPHLRGCICKLKPCVNFCCPYGQVHNGTDCYDASSELDWPHEINVTLRNGLQKTVDVFEQFAVVPFRPCVSMYALDPTQFPEDEWQMLENGTLYLQAGEMYLTREDFCMMTKVDVNGTNIRYLNPANCEVGSARGTVKIINAYAMLFSIPFMVLTIIVYLAIPELRNQHGKSLVCYLFGLIVGYSLMGASILNVSMDVLGIECKIVGYTCYYSFMSAFFWLNVISFDLWHNFRGTRGINRSLEKKRFIMYSLYSWGIPILFLLATMYVQEYVDIPERLQDDLKPGIGGGHYCWINMDTWAGFVYFFTPILFIMVANIIMFVMTAMKIHRVQNEMARIMAKEDSTRNLKKEKDKFGLFLRLFLVMGVTWSLEIISYFVGSDSKWAKIFYAADICNAVQGFLIFMLFVMKRKVKQLITNRYSSVRETSSNQRQSQYSNRTTTSSMGNLANNVQQSEKPLIRHLESVTSFD